MAETVKEFLESVNREWSAVPNQVIQEIPVYRDPRKVARDSEVLESVSKVLRESESLAGLEKHLVYLYRETEETGKEFLVMGLKVRVE